MVHRQCQITYVTNVYKEALMNAKKQGGGNDSTDDECCKLYNYILQASFIFYPIIYLIHG
jgi:hypothetical protein